MDWFLLTAWLAETAAAAFIQALSLSVSYTILAQSLVSSHHAALISII